MVKMGFGFVGLGHVGCQRTEKTVAQQDAEKRPDQRRRYFVPDFFRRPAQRAHGNDDAQNRRHNAQAG